MSYSLIKILSITIYVAENQNKKILVSLLHDYTKTHINKKQYIFLQMLIKSYKESDVVKKNTFYKIIDNYIQHFGPRLCKYLLYN